MPDRYAECDTLIPQKKNKGEDKTAALYYVKEQV